MLEITSASNAKIKYVRSLTQKKAREENGEYTVEGIKSVRDAVNSDRDITAIYVSFSFFDKEHFDYPENITLCRVSDNIFEKMCDTKAPQGILAVIRISDDCDFEITDGAYIYCDTVQDPGNLGTIIRTADAAGFNGGLLSEGCADLYNPKTVRSSMGSFFNTQVWRNVNYEKIAELKSSGFNIIGGTLSDQSIDYREASYKKPLIIVVGNEANGIRDEVLKICTHVKIPILGKAESLNAGVAAAILMYERVRHE